MEKKILVYLAIVLAVIPFFAGSQTKVSQLPYAGALTGTEAVPVVQSGQTVQASVNQFNAYTFGTLPFTVNGNKQVIFPGSTSNNTVTIGTLLTSTDPLQIISLNSANRATIVFNNGSGNNDYVGMDGGAQVLSDSTSGDLVFRSATGTSIRFGSLINSNQTMMRIGPNGNVNINAPSIATSTLNVFGVNGAFAENIQGGAGSNSGGLLIQGNYTGAGNVQLISLSDVNNGNGVNIAMNGNGGGQSCKTLRVQSGHFEVLNCAYTQNLFDVDDSGNAFNLGTYNAVGGLNINSIPLPGSPSTVFTVSGCGLAGSKTGTSVNGTFTVGTGASPCTFTFTFPTSPLGHGWTCSVDDATNNTHLAATTGGSATTCLVKGNAATSDSILLQSAFPY